MRLTRIGLFVRMHVFLAVLLATYFLVWLNGAVVQASVERPLSSVKLTAVYTVDGVLYRESFMRYDVPLKSTRIAVRYLRFAPHWSRINSFMGMAAEPLAWWGLWLLATGALLLIPNPVFSKHTVFVIDKVFPWISMEEYFPHEEEFRTTTGSNARKEKSKRKFLR